MSTLKALRMENSVMLTYEVRLDFLIRNTAFENDDIDGSFSIDAFVLTLRLVPSIPD